MHTKHQLQTPTKKQASPTSKRPSCARRSTCSTPTARGASTPRSSRCDRTLCVSDHDSASGPIVADARRRRRRRDESPPSSSLCVTTTPPQPTPPLSGRHARARLRAQEGGGPQDDRRRGPGRQVRRDGGQMKRREGDGLWDLAPSRPLPSPRRQKTKGPNRVRSPPFPVKTIDL